jgi:hypothetical protein
MTTMSTKQPYDIISGTAEGQRRAHEAALHPPTIEDDRRRAAIDPAAARRVVAAEAQARRVAAQRPAAPVAVPFRAPAAVATSPEDHRLMQALAVIENVRSYPVTVIEQRAYVTALPLLPQHSGLVEALAFACNQQTDTGAAAFTPAAIAEIRGAIQAVRRECGLDREIAGPDAA